MEKMKQYARIIDVFVLIAFWAAVIGMGIAIVFLCVFGLSHFFGNINDPVSHLTFTFQIAGMTFGYTNYTEHGWLVWLVSALTIITAMIGGGILIYALRQIHKAMKPLKEGTPFVPLVSGTFLKIGKLSLVYGIVFNIVMPILSYLLWRGLLNELQAGSFVAGGDFSMQFKLEFSFILVGVILLLFGYIFRYGETLQQQADETL